MTAPRKSLSEEQFKALIEAGEMLNALSGLDPAFLQAQVFKTIGFDPNAPVEPKPWAPHWYIDEEDVAKALSAAGVSEPAPSDTERMQRFLSDFLERYDEAKDY